MNQSLKERREAILYIENTAISRMLHYKDLSRRPLFFKQNFFDRQEKIINNASQDFPFVQLAFAGNLCKNLNSNKLLTSFLTGGLIDACFNFKYVPNVIDVIVVSNNYDTALTEYKRQFEITKKMFASYDVIYDDTNNGHSSRKPNFISLLSEFKCGKKSQKNDVEIECTHTRFRVYFIFGKWNNDVIPQVIDNEILIPLCFLARLPVQYRRRTAIVYAGMPPAFAKVSIESEAAYLFHFHYNEMQKKIQLSKMNENVKRIKRSKKNDQAPIEADLLREIIEAKIHTRSCTVHSILQNNSQARSHFSEIINSMKLNEIIPSEGEERITRVTDQNPSNSYLFAGLKFIESYIDVWRAEAYIEFQDTPWLKEYFNSQSSFYALAKKSYDAQFYLKLKQELLASKKFKHGESDKNFKRFLVILHNVRVTTSHTFLINYK